MTHQPKQWIKKSEQSDIANSCLAFDVSVSFEVVAEVKA
jgi:hypothetical protein